MDADDLLERNRIEKEAHQRFNELRDDFFSDRYREAYGASGSLDVSLQQPENSQKFSQHLVNKVMTETFVDKENKMRNKKAIASEKVMEIMIAQLDASK